MVSYYGGEYLVNFERYAQVLSQNFNVRIYLDGTRAETHGDNSIHLPNIKNISESELDCLYGILLHEIGHVKYSHLSNLELKKIKGRDHFSIWNGIEDARIENKLIAKLEGANDIFERMYGGQLRTVFKKIAGMDNSDDTDQWYLFCAHVHDYLLKTKRQNFNIDLYSAKVKEELLELFNKAKPMIDAQKITKAADSLSLASKLFKNFGPKRPEFTKEFSGVIGDMERCRRGLQEMLDAYKNNPELAELKRQKKELQSKRKRLEKEAEKTYNVKSSKEAVDGLGFAKDMLKYLEYMKSINDIKAESQKLKQEASEKLSQIEAIKQEMSAETV
jgi:predicted CopG family antitoxin